MYNLLNQMLKLRNEMVKSNPVVESRTSPAPNKSAGNSTAGSLSKESKHVKNATRLANLNYKIFKEYVGMYGVCGNDTIRTMSRFAQAMNEGSNIEKKIWISFIKFIRQNESMLTERKELNQAV
jgi:hypothetical protein